MNRHCLCLLLLLLLGSRHEAGASVAVQTSPQASTYPIGLEAPFTFTVFGLGGNVSLSAFSFKVTFDPGILVPKKVEFSDQLDLNGSGSIQFFDLLSPASISELSLATAGVLDASQADSINVATITFDTIGTGTSTVGLSDITLLDSSGNPLAVDFVGGASILVRSEVPEPMAFAVWSILSVFASAVAYRRR